MFNLNQFVKAKVLLCCSLFVFMVVGILNLPTAFGAEKDYFRLVTLSDIHFPGKNVEMKEAAIERINTWDDVDQIVILGDLTYSRGTEEEYAGVKGLFSKLKKPAKFIVGNHDYIYKDELNDKGKKVKGTPEERAEHLKRFKETFGMDSVYYTQKVGKYLLIYLSTDDLTSKYLTTLSETQLNWFRDALSKNRNTPTIVFFHGPLEGTFTGGNACVGSPNFYAQPADSVKAIIKQNPQIFLWVSGHTHFGATAENFSSPINKYENQVLDIHTASMKGKDHLSNNDVKTKPHNTFWINSLYLYDDKVVVKTYDFKKRCNIDSLERTIIPPVLK